MVRAIIANASETKAVSDLGFSPEVENQHKNSPSLAQLKGAIPPECFESSLTTSLLYLARDIVYASILVYLALRIDLLPNQAVRVVAWALYVFAQGCVGTGVWILGHECGHGAFSKYDKVNNFLGWLTHSALLVPYFSWKITHARHHRYTGNITKDAVFVPETEEDLKAENTSRLNKLLDMAEETSIVTVLRLLQHQLIGWQIYLMFNLTAGKQSLPAGSEQSSRRDRSHFTTSSALFLPSQKILVVLSDLGLLCTLGALWLASQHLGYQKVMLLYFGPYLWVHHWLGEFLS
jgi:fatty acid desaturase